MQINVRGFVISTKKISKITLNVLLVLDHEVMSSVQDTDSIPSILPRSSPDLNLDR